MKILSSLISCLLSLLSILALALYPINGKNTWNKPAMWLFMGVALGIYLIILLVDHYLKSIDVLMFYQVVVSLLTIACMLCGIFLTTGYLRVYTICVGIVGICNMGFYSIVKQR